MRTVWGAMPNSVAIASLLKPLAMPCSTCCFSNGQVFDHDLSVTLRLGFEIGKALDDQVGKRGGVAHHVLDRLQQLRFGSSTLRDVVNHQEE